ncbi:MAG TPA: aldolase/citrate lyase family protein [Bryobacteraceae bacterium]|nr:aldolase/citrate lyase family protein [Bryobacteraceae bacterium]
MNRLTQAIRKHGSTPLLGAAAYFYDPAFLEIAALTGYQVAWIEMEHTFLTFAQAADLCRIASGLGMLTMIRIPDQRRETVLKAAECGPDILDLPMANTPEILQEFVQNARFPPEGVRGFFSVSRAVSYGLAGNVADLQQKLNQELCLMVQVETKEASDRIEELCLVPGVEGIFLGPGDLSASLGVPGQTGHGLVREAAAHTVEVARRHGKQIAVGASPQDFDFWVDQGVDVLFCTNDFACLKAGAQSAIDRARSAIERAASKVTS